jgi:chromosome segregation ATPase
MATTSIKDRVYAAAERIGAERNPTVSSVREAAGVSNADATRYLKEWREEKAAAGTRIAATPQAVLEHAARLAGTVWAEAARLADDRHAAVQAQWETERKGKDQELAELVADLDRTASDKNREVAELQSQLDALGRRRQDAEAKAAAASREAEASREEAARLRSDLAAAQAKAETLQHTISAMIERLGTPEETTAPEPPHRRGKQQEKH